MDGSRFDAWTRRRFGLVTASLAAAALGGLTRNEPAAAKQRCRKNGTTCKKQGKKCKAQFCLKTPFTIEARWSNGTSDQDTFLFVPNEAGNNDPFPYLTVAYADCLSAYGNDGSVYPFASINHDAQGPGDEITTIRRLLNGTYEYWIELMRPSAPGEVTVALRNANGKVMRSWSSPENPSSLIEIGWHVFDINGAKGKITSVDEVTDDYLPVSAHAQSTLSCTP